MLLMLVPVATMLLAIFTVAYSARISRGQVMGHDSFDKQAEIVPHDDEPLRNTVQSAKDAPTIFSKTLLHVQSAGYDSRILILKAACDSSAFSCEQIIRLARSCLVWVPPAAGVALPTGPSEGWLDAVSVFAEGRNNSGCITDPENVMSIVNSFERLWPARSYWPAVGNLLTQRLTGLKQAFLANENLKPAKSIEPLVTHLRAGQRTDKYMEKVFADMEALQLIKAYRSQGSIGLYEPGSSSVEEFESWLKQVRAQGHQFSGAQLVALVHAIPKSPLGGEDRNSGTAQAVSVLLQYLEQYVTGVTCEEVKQIIKWMDRGAGYWQDYVDMLKFDVFLSGLHALDSNIIDGQNKVDIIAFVDTLYYSTNFPIISKTAKLLRDVGVGRPPKNNPIFGVVKGNPVIFALDESKPMDVKLILGNEPATGREFCHRQLETVLERLPKDTLFNVIQYSGSAVQIFRRPVVADKANIDAAMEAVSRTWRGDYTPGQDVADMVRNIQAFALNFKYHRSQDHKRKSLAALQLAYATADLLLDHTDTKQHFPRSYGDFVTASRIAAGQISPQIYLLTSGRPDVEASQILDNIDELDSGRNIPINSISFLMSADPVAKQFVKDLANKTGGFFRSIEQA